MAFKLALNNKGFTFYEGFEIKCVDEYDSIDDMPEFTEEPTAGIKGLAQTDTLDIIFEPYDELKEIFEKGDKDEEVADKDEGEVDDKDEGEVDDKDTEVDDKDTELTSADIEKMTVTEMKTFCQEKELEGYSTNTTRDDLKDFIIDELNL